MAKFIDDKIVHKDNAIEQIQINPNLYISYIGEKGVLHLFKEIFNNCVDECINPYSPGKEISIFIDGIENSVTVSDDGRGIPFESMELVCTKLHAGSKMTREGSGSSAGQNGIGMTAVNALSDYFEIVSYRYGEEGRIRFEKGKKVLGPVSKKGKKNLRGTTIIFKPNAFFMGSDCKINVELVYQWLEKISCLISNDIKITLSASGVGKESTFTKTFKNNTLADLTKKMCGKAVVSPVRCLDGIKVKEIVKDTKKDETGDTIAFEKELERTIGLEFAFTYDNTSSEFTVDSFCNFVNTIENGEHVDAVKSAVIFYLTRETKKELNAREASQFDIIQSDVLKGLTMCINVATDMTPMFTGQTKEKVSNKALFRPLREMTTKSLSTFFVENPKVLNKLVDTIKANAKLRVNAEKIKNSSIKGENNSFDDRRMDRLKAANNTGKNQYREIFLIEGGSAKGSASQGRFDNDTQALFAFRGVPLNSFNLPINVILDNNDEFKDLVRALRCNAGPKFDLSKLYYDKIIIMTDADIDGYAISSSICAFFLVHLRPIIEAGKLYKAVTPLYKIVDKKKPFILNKAEYIQVFEERIRDSFRVILAGKKEPMSNSEMEDFLFKNKMYLEELDRVSTHYAVNPAIIEFLALYLGTDMMKTKFKETFPELEIVDGLLMGVFDGKYQILRLNKIFDKKIEKLKRIIKLNDDNIYLHVYEKKKKDYNDIGFMTIGKFLTIAQKYQPVIKQRYKGLGELNPSELKETTLDPNNRILIRLTIDDIEKEIQQFKVIHGDNMSEEKRELMSHFKLTREDIDN